jgi:hypothetical protein
MPSAANGSTDNEPEQSKQDKGPARPDAASMKAAECS